MRFVKIKRLRQDVQLPQYATAGAVGLDLRAAIEAELVIAPGVIVPVPTGIAVEVPQGLEGQIRPRSGLASSGLTVVNTPGTIDQDYRGEIKVLLINLGQYPVRVRKGDRIAQLVFSPVERVILQEVAELEPTERGEGGFGSTGVS